MSSVMVFTPSWKSGAVCQAKTEMIASRDEVVTYAQENGVQCEVVTSYVNPYRSGNLENVLAQYEHARKLFLASEHSHVLFFEYDIVAPKAGLVDLLEMNVPVAYGVYKFRQAKSVLNVCRHVKAMYPDSSITLFKDEVARAFKMEQYPCSGAGFGFTLIERHVLERFEMHRSPIGGHPCPDMPFAADCMAGDVEQWAHFGVLCQHIKPDGSILYPLSINGNGKVYMEKIDYLVMETFNGLNDGQPFSFVEGQKVQVDEVNGAEYARAGYLQQAAIPKPPRKKTVRKPRKKVK